MKLFKQKKFFPEQKGGAAAGFKGGKVGKAAAKTGVAGKKGLLSFVHYIVKN